jgi:ParB-like chromosome segregation protein Spo0J
MKIVEKSVETLIPYIKNSRTHSDAQIAQIAASIKEFGWTNPILVDGENGIIAGHGRLMAARKLGHSKVPVIELKDMTETQKKAYIIADNQLAMNSGWDTSLLTLELTDLQADGFDLELLGFKVDELSILMGFGADFNAGTIEDQGKLDKIDPIICPSCGHEFHK